MQWMLDNKEWIFSGVGVALISAVIALLLRRNRHAVSSSSQSAQTSGNLSPQIHAGGNVTVSIVGEPQKVSRQGNVQGDEPARFHSKGRRDKSVCGNAYRLGFTLAKIAWYHGDDLQWQMLIDQATSFFAKLSVPRSISQGILRKFTTAHEPSAVLANARSALDCRSALSSVLEARLGQTEAAVFRFGFNLVYLLPQFEFMDMAREAALPFHELSGPMGGQIQNMIQDAIIAGIDDRHINLLRDVKPDAKSGASIRALLLTMGTAIDQELNDLTEGGRAQQPPAN